MSEALFKDCQWLKQLTTYNMSLSTDSPFVCFACQPRCSLRSHGGHLGLRPRCLCCIFLGRANSLRSFALLGLRPRAFYRIVEGANSLRSFAHRFGLRPHLYFCFASLADMFGLTPY